MEHYVYILQSEKDGTYYKGSSDNYLRRLEEHNNGLSQYTAAKLPWKLVYVERHPDKKSALIREKKLKRCKSDYFEWLIQQPSNLLNE